jgi:phosphopentomutase
MDNQIFELKYALDTFYFLVSGAFVMWMAAGFSMLEAGLVRAKNNTLVFVNFVDFDSHYGHRRDVVGYAKALEEFDARLPELEAMLQTHDVALITADHGCDPTQAGSDHTREHVPVLFFGPQVKHQNIGARTSFADMGQTLASHFGLPDLQHGQAIKLSSQS